VDASSATDDIPDEPSSDLPPFPGVHEVHMAELRLLLGDDHVMLSRASARSSKSGATGVSWPRPAMAGTRYREVLVLTPDVAILDIGMPLLNGIEATRQIIRRVPRYASSS